MRLSGSRRSFAGCWIGCRGVRCHVGRGGMNRGDSAGSYAKCGIIEKAKVATAKGDRLLTENKRWY